MSIYYFQPFSLEKKIGKECNHYMGLINDDDWAVFLDRDVMFLEPNYGEQIAEVIKQNPNAGIITCLTNRIGSTCQLLKLDNNLNNDSDILTHKQISSYLKNTYANSTIKVAAPLSFFVTIVSKKVWKQVGGYDEKFDMLHFDWDFSYKVQNAGYDLLLMQGMYVFHYYRLHSHIKDISHLV